MNTLLQKCAKHQPNKLFVLKPIKTLFLKAIFQNT